MPLNTPEMKREPQAPQHRGAWALFLTISASLALLTVVLVRSRSEQSAPPVPLHPAAREQAIKDAKQSAMPIRESIEIPEKETPGGSRFYPEGPVKTPPASKEPVGVGRFPYPPRILKKLPEGVTAREFVRTNLQKLVELQGKKDKVKERIETEDLIAETAAGVPEVVRELVESARRGDEGQKDLAFLILGRLPGPEALDFLLHDALASPDPIVRLAAVRALRQDQGWNVGRGWRELQDFSEPRPGPVGNGMVADAIFSALGRETDTNVLKNLISMLAFQSHEGQFFNDEDQAAHPDGLHSAARVASAFLDLFNRLQDVSVRELLLPKLASSGLPDAQTAVLRIAKDDPEPKVRASAVLAMNGSILQRPDALQILRDTMSDTSATVRLAAAQTAMNLGRDDETCKRLILAYQNDPDPGVQSVAFRSALYNLTAGKAPDGTPATPDFGAAIRLLDEVAPKGQVFQRYAYDAAVRIESSIQAGRFKPSDQEMAVINRIKQSPPR